MVGLLRRMSGVVDGHPYVARGTGHVHFDAAAEELLGAFTSAWWQAHVAGRTLYAAERERAELPICVRRSGKWPAPMAHARERLEPVARAGTPAMVTWRIEERSSGPTE